MNADKVSNGNQCTNAARAAENVGIRSDGFAIATGDTDKLPASSVAVVANGAGG